MSHITIIISSMKAIFEDPDVRSNMSDNNLAEVDAILAAHNAGEHLSPQQVGALAHFAAAVYRHLD